jgi:hypothetical protein
VGEIEQLTRAASSGCGAEQWLETVFRSVYLDARDEFDRACTQCASAVGDAFDVATQWLTDAFPSSLPVAEPSASGAAASPFSFSIGGNVWGFSITPDGRGVSLDVTGADGSAASVSVELDENGWPRIVFDADQQTLQEPPQSEVLQPELPVETTTEVSTTEVSAAEVLPGPEMEPDAEPTVAVPEESSAVPADETGAELAGAGPL